MNKFIVVCWYNEIPYMLQYRNVVNYYFYNNRIKVFKTSKTAIATANKLSRKYLNSSVKVYTINDNDYVGTDYIRNWDNSEKERIVFEIKNF